MEHMGHFINVFDFKKTDDLKKDKEEIFFEAEDWGDYESDTRKYHGNLSFKTDTVFETRPDAERYLKQFQGFGMLINQRLSLRNMETESSIVKTCV